MTANVANDSNVRPMVGLAPTQLLERLRKEAIELENPKLSLAALQLELDVTNAHWWKVALSALLKAFREVLKDDINGAIVMFGPTYGHHAIADLAFMTAIAHHINAVESSLVSTS